MRGLSVSKSAGFARARRKPYLFSWLGCEPLEERRLLAVTHLVRDINEQPSPIPSNFSSDPGGPYRGQMVYLDGLVYFAATDAAHGFELWKSDGTLTGTVMVKDINPGPTSAYIYKLLAANGKIYFTAISPLDDYRHGHDIWSSDGTAAGTVMILDTPDCDYCTRPQIALLGDNVFATTYLRDEGSKLYFLDGTPGGTVLLAEGSAGAGIAVGDEVFFTNGSDLMKTDGTVAGTVLVKHFDTPTNQVESTLAVGDTLYLIAYDAVGAGTHTLWKSDGTLEGTVRVKQFADRDLFDPRYTMKEIQGSLFLFLRDLVDADGSGSLWRSDGTEAGTIKAVDVPGLSLGQVVNGQMYYTIYDGTGTKLWATDGTQAGTRELAQLNVESTTYVVIREFLAADNLVYFQTQLDYDDANLHRFWVTDGTAEGTKIFNQEASLGTVVGDRLYFVGSGDDFKNRLWLSDGTTNAGSVAIGSDQADSQGYDWSPGLPTAAGNRVFFAGASPYGSEFWTSDGTSAGTYMVKDINPWPGPNPGSRPISEEPYLADKTAEHSVKSGGQIYFLADDGIHGRELWKSDGTRSGTAMVRDLTPGPRGTNFSELMDVGGTLYFIADAEYGRQIWKSNGTESGTMRLSYFYSSWPSLAPDSLINVAGTLYFRRRSIFTWDIWKSEETGNGTVLVKTFESTRYESLFNLAAFGSQLLFSSRNAAGVEAIRITDGTPTGTRVVKVLEDFTQGKQSFTQFNGEAYFTVRSRATKELILWKTDGTEAGTTMVSDGFQLDDISRLSVSGGQLFFVGRNANTRHNEGLWKTDGTAAGTVQLYVRDGSTLYSPQDIDGTLYFAEYSPYPYETNADHFHLWKSDGTISGTVDVKSLQVLGTGSDEPVFTGFNGAIYFRASESSDDVELWRTDGTPEGTVPALDLRPGIESSYPFGIQVLGNQLLFRADDGVHGSELYSLTAEAAHVEGRHIFYNNSAFDQGNAAMTQADDLAIAPDKAALLPGENAIFTNYTTNEQGINGIIIDIDGVNGSLTTADFEFHVGHDDTPADWTLAPAPLEILVRTDGGVNNTDRVTITWPDGSIVNQWLQVTVKATAATGLEQPDVFYFGNAVGDTLNHPFNTIVNAMDEIGIRNHATDSAAINDQYDINRDSAVNATDEMIARASSTTLDTALPLIRPRIATSQTLMAPALVAGPVLIQDDARALRQDFGFTLPMLETADAARAASALLQLALPVASGLQELVWQPLPAANQQLAVDYPSGRGLAHDGLAPVDDDLLELLVDNCPTECIGSEGT